MCYCNGNNPLRNCRFHEKCIEKAANDGKILRKKLIKLCAEMIMLPQQNFAYVASMCNLKNLCLKPTDHLCVTIEQALAFISTVPKVIVWMDCLVGVFENLFQNTCTGMDMCRYYNRLVNKGKPKVELTIRGEKHITNKDNYLIPYMIKFDTPEDQMRELFHSAVRNRKLLTLFKVTGNVRYLDLDDATNYMFADN